MNEAKSLVHMAISAMFAALIIGAAMSLIGLGYKMWAYFSRQDMANQRMNEYVNYVAYDDTTIQGQEVITLLKYAEDNGLFLAVFIDNAQTPGTMHINDVVPNTSNMHFYFPDACPYESIHDACVAGTFPVTHDNVNVSSALSAISTYIANNSSPVNCPNCLGRSDVGPFSEKVKLFTNNLGSACALGFPNGDKTYAAFKSVLVYDSDISTNVVGVALIQQTTVTKDFR